MIGGRRPLQGRKPADRRVRVERPHAPVLPLHRARPAGRQAGRQRPPDPDRPVLRRGCGRSSSAARCRTRRRSASACRRRKALAIFSSDAISSSAYATEEILRVLVLAGASALFLSIQVSIAIAILLAVVSVSYRQVCRAYPNGGGAYVVAKTNLAPIFGLIAAAALLIDYVMTVSVSTAAAIAQIQSVIPAAYDVRIEIAFISISLITIANLRGLRESGQHLRGPDLPVRRAGARDRRDRRWSTSSAGPSSRSRPSPTPCRSRRALETDRHPAPAQGLRRRLGRADRRRGHRQRRARRSSRRRRRTRPTR